MRQVVSISQKIGEINAKYLSKPEPKLRKRNKIKTIHSSLQIEGNSLSEEQITAILENKRVVGPKKDILEVVNAVGVYSNLTDHQAFSEKSFLSAHKLLMNQLIENAGRYRKKSVGIVNGSKVEHLAPPYENVPFLMKNLFKYVKNDKEISLIKSCVFHYEMEFIHPFIDGNGRMGRLWQTLILMRDFPVFEFLPFETLISENQREYYKALSQSDNQGKSTIFIEYMLGIINTSLSLVLSEKWPALKDTDRVRYFVNMGNKLFTRKDYMNTFRELSTATASRDLRKAIDDGLLRRTGDKKTSRYHAV